ncbi:TetR/AcrR family transcriptional regulator [Hymenobacter sp. HSC-4F20]|uniref:TetR/AcrR family transcriptional regulator n=1 Tax=Hymenobacter sp. HSC-4F20 TaxID=2864135 RepID=UPI001C736440|nr:TetR/AcrR family transcriptional regulator [Hymenobacter sp. HSC-4F20]MBX0290181.1 TetR/AcrR family transcriptional regulator [Hymenobacter sp. HSC-4F20]
MNTSLRIDIPHRLYLRDPQETELGRRMIAESIRLMDEIGLEQFTFRKLAQRMASTEASLYRYFENKHRLLGYLVSWHWAWLRFRIRFHIHNIPSAAQRLHLILSILTQAHRDDPTTTDLDEAALYRLVVSEASKAYLIRCVDEDHRAGLFREYHCLVADIAGVLRELNPDYAYPQALASTLLEEARKQLFFSQHLPTLTETTENTLYDFLHGLLFGTLSQPPPAT